MRNLLPTISDQTKKQLVRIENPKTPQQRTHSHSFTHWGDYAFDYLSIEKREEKREVTGAQPDVSNQSINRWNLQLAPGGWASGFIQPLSTIK